MRSEDANESMKRQLLQHNCSGITLSEDESTFDRALSKRCVADGIKEMADRTGDVQLQAQEYLDEMTAILYTKIKDRIGNRNAIVSLLPALIRKYEPEGFLLGFRLYASVCVI